MKKNLNIWQRLLAFAMVCVMIVGYLPVFAAAEGEGAGVAIDGFTVKVVCTALAEKTVEMVPTDIPVLDDEGNQKMDDNGQPLYEMKETEVYNITGYECTPKYNDYEGMVLTYGPDGYTFTYQGKKLKVEHTHIQEVTQEVTTVEESYEWAATIQPWADIPACKAIAAPVIQLSEGASFEAEPVWTITDANGNTVNVGDEAKVEMDTLTAKTTINGKEYTQTAKVTYAAAEYTFSHTSGWYAEMPEVTVTAITENPVDQIAPVEVDGTICEWVKDEITGNYIVTIPAEEGETSKTISVVGKETHTLNVDNTELSISNLRAVAHKEKTLVKFTYVAGNSGADANINGASVKLDPALDGRHYEYYIEDVVDTVDVKLTNIMGKEASATCNVVPYPTVTHSGIIGFKDQVAYVAKNDANIIFTMNNAHGNVEWTVLSGSTDAGFAQVDEQGHSIRVPVSAETPFLDGLNATGTDAGGRTVGDGIGAVAVDLTAPEVTITGLQTTEKTYVNENQTYTVAVSDDIAMSGVVARYYLENDNLGTEFDVAEGFTITDGMHLRKVEVKATDVSGNETVEIMETNVEVDTTAPVLSATISAYVKDENGEYTVPANATAIYSSGDKSFLKFDKVESTEIDGSIKVIVKFTADEKNIPADSEWADGEKTVEMIIPEKTVQEFAISGITLKDKAGNVPTGEVGIAIGGADSETKLHLNLSAGVYNGSIYIDRRTPTDNETLDTEVPTITLKAADTTNYEMVGEKRIFQGPTASFNVAVKDDSGLDLTVTAEVVGEGVSVPATVSLKEDGTGVINISIAEGAETTECTVIATVTDKAGNYFVYMENFGVDYKEPEMYYTITPAADDTYQHEDGKYHKQNVKVSFGMSDMLPFSGKVEFTITNDNKDGAAENKTVTLSADKLNDSITLTKGQRLTKISMTATDLLENTYTSNHAVAEIVDADAPVAEITLVPTEEEAPVIGADGVHYYEKTVTFKVKVTDENFKAGTGEVTYYLNGEGQKLTLENGVEQTITLVEGDILTDLKVTGTDKAENVGEKVYPNKVAMDAKDPVVTITKSLEEADFIQHFGGKAFYNGSIKYTVTVEDSYIDLDNTVVKFNGSAVAMEGNTNLISGEFTVVNGTYLTDIEIAAKDMYGHTAKASDLIVNDPIAAPDTTFEGNDGTMSYTGPDVVVDTEAPKAVLTLKGNVESYYSREVDGVEHFFVKLTTPVDEGLNLGGSDETVDLTIKVEDPHLSIVTENIAADTNVVVNNGKGKLSQDGTVVTYTDSITVKKDKTGIIVIDLTAHDLAGWPMELMVDAAGDGTTLTPAVENGLLKTNLVVDRRRPTTDGEDAVPVITINMPDAGGKKSLKGVDLYTEPFALNIGIADGSAEGENAGLKSIEYAIVDDHKVLDAGEKREFAWTAAKMNDTFNLTVGKNGDETNRAVLTVTAIDNMDNKITKQVEFAVDTLAPRINAHYNNNDVRNDKYFNKARTIEIEVQDLNFDAGTTLVNGSAVSWNGPEGVYSCSVDYSTEGDHEFSMHAFDLGGLNTAASEKSDTINWTNNDVAQYIFTLDWTAPKINVTYNPAAASGRDGNGVNYYDKIQNVTATITEHNFTTAAEDGAGVFTTVNPANGPKFGAWSQGGDEHVSHITFPEGNLYSFSIDCTDLAGNKAVGYESQTFSVDTTAPTIEITKGDLKNDGLNIVQDDLDLGFTIHDEQKNLSDYKVTVTQLNNEFNKIEVSGSEYYTITEQEDRTTVVVNFKAIAQEKLNDGLYTVEITAKDYAGNTVKLTPDLVFSLNRFGSTFMTDDEYTLEFLALGTDGNVYHREVEDKLIIHEINPNKVWNDSSKKAEGSVLTVIVNGTSTKLVEGKDYKMTVTEQGSGDSRWYVYTYEIDPETFEMDDALVDGRYSILISGEDDAGNKNTNQSDDYGKLQKDADGEYNGKIEFVLDTTAPIITTAGIESGKNYDAEAQKLEIFLSDSTPSAITVYLNGELVNLSEMVEGLAENAQWLVYDEESNSYILNVPEMNTLFSGQEIRIVVIDAAGNEAELIINDFSVSTNVFVRLLNSTWFIVSLIVLIILIVLAILLKLKKRKVHAA